MPTTTMDDDSTAGRIASGTPLRYPSISKWFHWTVAALVLVVLPLGFATHLVVNEVRPTVYLLHESLGFLILWVMIARVVTRLLVTTPKRPPMPKVQRVAAAAVQGLLYVALIAQPVIGFLMANASGYPLKWFGIFTVPSPIGPSPQVAEALERAHGVLGFAILALFALHLAGALWHQAIRRDALIERMI